MASEPPIGSLFSAFLGYNPIKELLGPTGALQHLPPSQAAYITGRSFFPQLIEQPFAAGLHLAFTFAAIATVIAIVASALRGRRYLHTPRAGAGGAGRGRRRGRRRWSASTPCHRARPGVLARSRLPGRHGHEDLAAPRTAGGSGR